MTTAEQNLPSVGMVIEGRYRLLAILGRGGVGTVYEAERITDGAVFALKRLDRAATHDKVAMGRFAREVRAASAARSEYIARVVDVGVDGDCPFLLMDRLRGEDLGARLHRVSRLGQREAVELGRQVLAGLEAAHAAGVVHRDLKPDNIFLEERPQDDQNEDPPIRAKILDFGMSKIEPIGSTLPLNLTRVGVAVGTPLYMSPEQASARPDVDARSDLYSVAAILFECLTGRPPHVGETSDVVLRTIRTTPAPPIRRVASRIPRSLAQVIDRALLGDRSARYRTASEMRRALEMCLPDLEGPLGGRATRTLWLAGFAAVALGVMIAVATASFLRGRLVTGAGAPSGTRP